MAVLLSCECGNQISVSEGAAGASIQCAECRHAIKVPSLGEMRQLTNIDDSAECPSAGHQLPHQRAASVAAALLIGFGAVVFTLGVGLLIGNVTGLFPTFPFAGFVVSTVGVAILGAGCRAFAECRGG
jgi:uncharacterized paraquat-inducible protein A